MAGAVRRASRAGRFSRERERQGRLRRLDQGFWRALKPCRVQRVTRRHQRVAARMGLDPDFSVTWPAGSAEPGKVRSHRALVCRAGPPSAAASPPRMRRSAFSTRTRRRSRSKCDPPAPTRTRPRSRSDHRRTTSGTRDRRPQLRPRRSRFGCEATARRTARSRPR